MALPAGSDQFESLCAWVAESCTGSEVLLDIGAGDGDDVYAARIAPLVGRYVGVDPDPRSKANPALAEWFPMTVEEYASTHPDSADLAIAVYVAEHVESPERFLQAARACLRAPAALYLLTPNLWSYFAPVSLLTSRLGLEGRLLRLLRSHHPELGHVGHFPPRYRLNSATTIARLARRAGFGAVEVRHLEDPGIFESYFPGRLVALPRAYSRMVTRLGWQEIYGTLLVKIST